MFTRPTRVLSGLVVCGALFQGPVFGQEDDYVAWSVSVVSLGGAEFTGFVPRTARSKELFESGGEIDPAKLPAEEMIILRHFNGLNGSIGFRFGELKKIEVLRKISSDAAKELEKSAESARQARLVKEASRLRIVQQQRAAREQAEQEQQAEEGASISEIVIPPDLQQWLDEFPPDEGWVPAKKAQLYYLHVVLNTHTLTVAEQRWVDNYDAWKSAYDLWLRAEQAKRALEEQAKRAAETGEPGPAVPTGDARPEASGTAGSAAADTDPDNPPPEAGSNQPPPIDPGAPEPDKVSPDVPKPVPLEKGVPKPVKTEEGGAP